MVNEACFCSAGKTTRGPKSQAGIRFNPNPRPQMMKKMQDMPGAQSHIRGFGVEGGGAEMPPRVVQSWGWGFAKHDFGVKGCAGSH